MSRKTDEACGGGISSWEPAHQNGHSARRSKCSAALKAWSLGRAGSDGDANAEKSAFLWSLIREIGGSAAVVTGICPPHDAAWWWIRRPAKRSRVLDLDPLLGPSLRQARERSRESLQTPRRYPLNTPSSFFPPAGFVPCLRLPPKMRSCAT